MRFVATDGVAWWSVCLSITIVSPAETAQLIQMLFGMRTWVGQSNYVVDGVQLPHGKGHF